MPHGRDLAGQQPFQPYFKAADGSLKTFDFAVANPPFSFKAWSNGFNPGDDLYKRFTYGVPPDKNGDYAFLLHILTSLKSTGKGAVILPHGVLFRGGAEASIRRKLVSRGYIKGIIGLPANLFYGTGIPACILVLDKEGAAARQGIFMIDSSKAFLKDGNKNRLRAQDIHKIVDVFNRQVEIARYSRLVPLDEISDERNNFNLNLPRYIDSTEPEDLQDIDAHLRGGIPERDIDALQRYWAVFPSVRHDLFAADRPGYVRLQVAADEVKTAIFGHAEFRAFQESVSFLFDKWKTANGPRLKGIAPGDKPKALIGALSEDLLETFREARLLNAYDVYQHLMDYWEATMQDDVYLLALEGWKAVLEGKPNIDLIPAELIVRRYFAEEQAAVDALEAERDALNRQMEELDEEHGGEEGLLAEGKNDRGKLTRASVKVRLKEAMYEADAAEEQRTLEECLALIDREAAASKAHKDAQRTLEKKVHAKYVHLGEDEIKTLVVDGKWLVVLAAETQRELDRLSQTLTGRVRQLAERYVTPLPRLVEEVDLLTSQVNENLKKMGFAWN